MRRRATYDLLSPEGGHLHKALVGEKYAVAVVHDQHALIERLEDALHLKQPLRLSVFHLVPLHLSSVTRPDPRMPRNGPSKECAAILPERCCGRSLWLRGSSVVAARVIGCVRLAAGARAARRAQQGGSMATARTLAAAPSTRGHRSARR